MQRALQLEGGEAPGPLFAPGVSRKKAKNRARGKARVKALKQATPPWADKSKIRWFYRTARQMSEEFGAFHTVDHIIPLHHPQVCGLHVETNLQILLHEDNLAKGNNWSPDQQDLFDGFR